MCAASRLRCWRAPRKRAGRADSCSSPGFAGATESWGEVRKRAKPLRVQSVGRRDTDDPVERCLGNVKDALRVEDDAAGVAELAGHDADFASRRDPEDLTDLVAGTDEDAPVRAS